MISQGSCKLERIPPFEVQKRRLIISLIPLIARIFSSLPLEKIVQICLISGLTINQFIIPIGIVTQNNSDTPPTEISNDSSLLIIKHLIYVLQHPEIEEILKRQKAIDLLHYCKLSS